MIWSLRLLVGLVLLHATQSSKRRDGKRSKRDASLLLPQHPEVEFTPSTGNLQYDSKSIGAKPMVCPDTSICPDEETYVFRIQGGDAQAAFASIFFLYVVNGIQYAWHKEYIPWIDLDPSWSKKTMPLAANEAPRNIWEDFFEPYCGNISQWIQRCGEAKIKVIEKPRTFWFPQVHVHYAWPVRAWYYMKCPDACRRLQSKNKISCTDHKRLLCPKASIYDHELYASWRIKAHSVASRAHRPTKKILRQASRIFKDFSQHSHPTLAVHARGTDKGHGRRTVHPAEFGYTILSFLNTFPDKGRVYLASDDSSLIRDIISFCQQSILASNNTTKDMSFFNHTMLTERIYLRNIQTRSSSKIANFKLSGNDKFHVARDVLIDILVMSHCEFFVHAASAVAEAVFYLNLRLHGRSVNLEFTRSSLITMPWSHLELFRFDSEADSFRPFSVPEGGRPQDFYALPS